MPLIGTKLPNKGLSTQDAYALRHGHGTIFTACVCSVNFVLNAAKIDACVT